MKLVGGCLIALAVFWIWMIVGEYALAIIHAKGQFVFNWPDLLAPVGYLGIGLLMLVLGIVLWRRKPKNWLW